MLLLRLGRRLWVYNILVIRSRQKTKGYNFFFYIYRSEVVEIFREKDRDLSGTMSFEEFCGRHESRNEIGFKAIDKDGDGFISRSEFKRICPNMSKEQMDRAFAKFDKDETGRINYREYCAMLNKRQDKVNSATDTGGGSSGTNK